MPSYMVGVTKGDDGMLEFFSLTGRLKAERRRGWVRRLRVKDAESVADHSYRVALMSMVYSDLKGLDTARALKIAMLHDLPEALVGDSMPGELPRRTKLVKERIAMERLLKSFPRELRSEYKHLWEEYVRGLTPEADLVKQVDKLELILQAREYEREGYDANLVNEFVKSARRKIRDADLLKIL